MLHINIFGPMTEHAGIQNGLRFKVSICFVLSWNVRFFVIHTKKTINSDRKFCH